MIQWSHITLGLCLLHACLFGNQISPDQERFIERYKNQQHIVPAEQALINTEAEPDLDQKGFVSLYNGENLDGWTPLGGTCSFEPIGESIVGTCVPGSPSTYLSTDKSDYTDFIFSAEVKWAVNGNSGIMFRSNVRKEGGNTIVYGPQCEMEGFGQNRGWSGGIFGQSIGGWRYPLWLDAHAEARGALKKDDWNRVTIKAVGKDIKTWINGIPAAHWQTEEYLEGFFSLQVHSGKQGTLHFRNIKVKELTAAAETNKSNCSSCAACQ